MRMTRTLLTFVVLCCAIQSRADPDTFLRNGVTAHRGNSGECPENTLQAFESAIALGADWIETDLYVTKDSQLVISHDRDTGHTGDRRLSITNSTYAELLTVDVATGFRTRNKLTRAQCPPARMPLFADALRLVMKQNRTRLSIQPKDDCVQAAFDVIRALGAERWVGFNDGSLKKMQQVKQLSKAVPVFWDRDAKTDIDRDITIAREQGFEAIVVNAQGLTKAKVDKIRAAGFVAGGWTVNNEAEMKAFLAMGVQRFYTDYPARLLRLKADGKQPPQPGCGMNSAVR